MKTVSIGTNLYGISTASFITEEGKRSAALTHIDACKLLAAFNTLVTNGISHHSHLDESTFIFRVSGSDFSFLFHFSMKIKTVNKIAADGTPRFAILFAYIP